MLYILQLFGKLTQRTNTIIVIEFGWVKLCPKILPNILCIHVHPYSVGHKIQCKCRLRIDLNSINMGTYSRWSDISYVFAGIPIIYVS